MRRWHSRLALATSILALAAACAAPVTQVGTVSLDAVRAEQQEQLRLAAQMVRAHQERLDRIAAPLLRAAAPLCQQSASRTAKSGLVTPSVESCPFRVVLLRDDALNAAADGEKIYVATAMMRFANDDELAVVLAHEIAHNAMRHRDAQARNALGGALLGAMADIAVAAATHGRSSTNVMQAGAQAGAQAFSQDFEREADYVGLYILAWAGAPTANAADFWRRMAAEHPAGIVFATTHPTTAERFVRLEQWDREIQRKIVAGVDFGPEMRDPRMSVVSRAAVPAALAVSNGEVEEPSTIKRAATPAPLPAPAHVDSLARLHAQEQMARSKIHVPRSDADRRAAASLYDDAMNAIGAQRWGEAKADITRALQLDASVAAYHAALGEVLIVEKNWPAAKAEFRAALLLEPDNHDYQVGLQYARVPR